MNKKRHKWKKDMMKSIPFESTYKVDQCFDCNCLRLHKYEGKLFFPLYVIEGKEYNILPKCEPIKYNNMAKVKFSRVSDSRIQLSTSTFRIEFDPRYAEKEYPVRCNFYNMKINDQIIKEIESSKIVRFDNDLTAYSINKCDSSALLIPQFGFSLETFVNILSSFISNQEDRYQSQFDG